MDIVSSSETLDDIVMTICLAYAEEYDVPFNPEDIPSITLECLGEIDECIRYNVEQYLTEGE